MIRIEPALVLLAMLCWSGSLRASEARGDDTALALEAHSSTACYSDPAAFRLSVTFHNSGDEPLLVLPARIRREYRSDGEGAARYTPYPGPPRSPWAGAFGLPPHSSRATELAGMRDGDGIWKLDAGTYHLLLRYAVGPDLESQRATAGSLPDEVREIPLWVGEVKSAPLVVLHDPALRSSSEIDLTRPDPCIRTALFRVIGSFQLVSGARRSLEAEGFGCAFSEDGFLVELGLVRGRHLHCRSSGRTRARRIWHVGILPTGDRIQGMVALPE